MSMRLAQFAAPKTLNVPESNRNSKSEMPHPTQ